MAEIEKPGEPKRMRPGPWPGSVPSLPSPSSTWAARTGFRPKFSGEANTGERGQIVSAQQSKEHNSKADLEAGVRNDQSAVPIDNSNQAAAEGRSVKHEKDPPVKRMNGEGAKGIANGKSNGPPQAPRKRRLSEDPVVDVLQRTSSDDGFGSQNLNIKYKLRDTPGFIPITLYGFQHYISMMGSLIITPLVIVPAMGGTLDDTAVLVSTVLLVSGLSTLLQTSLGSRLPLVQGSSLVFLAPALAIINSPEFQGLNGDNFKHIMKELQGSIVIASSFQFLLGYSGLMSVLSRFINPVVVSPTVAAIGLSFYSYGFPRVGTCLEIGAVHILLAILFSLYLRKISIFGHRIFLIYAVPLSLAITWAVAFLLTEAGAYSYKACDASIPSSNILLDRCRKHVSRMKYCRADMSHALAKSPWFRFPYPLQWGTPVFQWKMAVVMCIVSLISSLDSIGSYHATSLLVASKPPTTGVVSRGVAIEGFSSVLAGLWGTGTGSSTLTENVHTIAVTKMGSRRAVELGACLLVVLSFVGKVGGFIASIPEVMIAALLCFMCAMLAALGLSNLRYSEAGSSRNIIIVGLSLFFSLSIPAYFQQHGISQTTIFSVPSYLQPYVVTSHGPFHTIYGGLNYVMNTLLSLHMVIAFLTAVILDNTIPGSRHERGVYTWSEVDDIRQQHPEALKDYALPYNIGRVFKWVRWVGL